MVRFAVGFILLTAVTVAIAANPPSGKASDNSVEVAAIFLDAAAIQQATGADFKGGYTVVEVTVTPKGGKSLDVDPDDFLMRINSNSDSSGPMAASLVYGAGSSLVLHSAVSSIGITRTDPGYSGVSVSPGSASPAASADAIQQLQSKMLPAKKTTAPVTGLLFFPLAKRKAHDLDLVYTSPDGKLHISFH